MLYQLRRFIASIFRAGQSCGFGIQSPFAFRFVTEVVRDRKDYVEYASFEENLKNGKDELRLKKFYCRLLRYMNEEPMVDSLFIIEGIHRSRESYQLWCDIIEGDRVTLSLDLFDCGILFLDSKFFKCNYKVML